MLEGKRSNRAKETSNHPEHLDPALRRAGRFDVQVPFHHANHSQANSLFRHFYPLSDSETEDATSDEKNPITSAAQLEQHASDFADAVFLNHDTAALALTDIKTDGISMAALQGYLLGFKDDPLAAIAEARAWAEGHSEQKVPRKVVLSPAPPAKAKGAAKAPKKKTGKMAPSVPSPVSAEEQVL